jgi:hypothetical protein
MTSEESIILSRSVGPTPKQAGGASVYRAEKANIIRCKANLSFTFSGDDPEESRTGDGYFCFFWCRSS